MIFYMGSDHINPISFHPLDRDIKLVENSLADDGAFKNVMSMSPYDDPYAGDAWFAAVSGTELLPVTGDPGAGPDSGNRATTRIGIAYKKSSDQFFILEGGGYANGLTRENLASAFKALGADIALELDGGGSAAVAVNMLKAEWTGMSTDIPTSSCSDSIYVCAPITQPSGVARPVPGFLYISVPSGSLDRPQVN